MPALLVQAHERKRKHAEKPPLASASEGKSSDEEQRMQQHEDQRQGQEERKRGVRRRERVSE